MRILVTGATGFLGYELGKFLTAQGHQLVVLVRSASKSKELNKAFPCLSIQADLENYGNENLISLLQQTPIDAVIHLAGESINQRWTNSAKKRILSSRTETTNQLLQCFKIAKANPPTIFLSASAIGFYGDRTEESLTEFSSAGTGFLSEVCQKWESSVFAFTKDPFFQSTRWIQARLGVILDPKQGAFPVMIKPFLYHVGAPIGFHNPWMSWMHIHDFLQGILFCLQNNKIQGPVNFVSPDPVRQKDFAEVISQSLGTICLPPIPSFALELLLGERAQLILASQKVIPQVLKEHGFDWKFKSYKTTLLELVNSYISNQK